jgi:glycosyltransferase involved in cell wall biosynthesis
MKIAIINLTGGGMSGGYKKYLQNVLPRMAVHSDVKAILCAAPESLNIQGWFKPLPKVEFISCKPYRFLGLGTNLELNRCLQEFSPDVVFVPAERHFWFNKVPIVRIIQNMEPFVTNIDGNPFKERVRQWIQAVDAKRAIKKSNRIIAVSEFVRDFLVQKWKIQPEQISVVYYGINLPENKGQRPALIPNDWEGQFLFTAGSIRPARGLEDVLNAVRHLFDKSSNMPGLVIAGETTSAMMKYKKKLKDWIKTYNLSSKVCWTGNLNENEMAWCYQNCRAFVITSRVESFGMIAGEAMSHGCICISADNPCLPEIFGDAAVYYPAKNGKALASAIQTVLNWDDNQRKTMSEKAKKHAGKFSWDICVEKTVAELANAVEDRQSRKL